MTEIIQGTEEWFAARRGKVTASRVADIIATTKAGPSASRDNYAAELIAERLSGATAPSFTNAAMQWGTETEPQARAAYCFHRDVDVVEVGFVDHPVLANAGASPDGLVGDEGLIEIKCPNTATHLATLESGKIPAKYVTQMVWQMACTGRQWCDFVCFDPRLPPAHQLFIQRVLRDEQRILELEGAVTAFLAEVAERIERLNARIAVAA